MSIKIYSLGNRDKQSTTNPSFICSAKLACVTCVMFPIDNYSDNSGVMLEFQKERESGQAISVNHFSLK